MQSEKIFSDMELLEKAKLGDGEVVNILVGRYWKMVYHTCFRILKNKHDAEDVAQEVFAAFNKNLNKVRESPSGWLYSVAVSLSKNLIVKSVRRRKLMEENLIQKETEVVFENKNLLKLDIDLALGKLAEKYRAPVTLVCMEGMSNRDASDILGLSQPQISRRVITGKDKLQKIMKKLGFAIPIAALPALLHENTAIAVPPSLFTKVSEIISGNIPTGTIVAGLEYSVTESISPFQQIWRTKMAKIFLFFFIGIGGLFGINMSGCSGCLPLQPPPPNAAGIQFVHIQAGSFVMGSPATEPNRNVDEGPQHTVTISKSFYIGKFEITQAQYQSVIGSNPSVFSGANLPVESITWNEAVAFCVALSASDPNYTYRLPTEAEWEYCYRAGTSSVYYWGATWDDNYGWNISNANRKTYEVGGKIPNSWGLYDMSGNAYEWCSDWYSATTYTSSPQTDPVGPATGSNRVIRGGSCFSSVNYCRAAYRSSNPPDFRNDSGFGFRVVAVPK